jgi:hypothetical protein
VEGCDFEHTVIAKFCNLSKGPTKKKALTTQYTEVELGKMKALLRISSQGGFYNAAQFHIQHWVKKSLNHLEGIAGQYSVT